MKKILTGFLISVMAAVLICVPAFAEVSASLADNVLEYDEIDGLIHEYNVTVRSNVNTLRKFKKDYGVSNDEIAESYWDMASALYDSIDYGADPSMDPTYGMKVSAALANMSYADSLMSTGDSTVEDYETYRLGYEMTEKALAQSAKVNMISYYAALLSERQASLNVQLLESALETVKQQAAQGMATQADVFSASEKLLSARQSLAAASASARSSKKKLQIMCGWKYSSEAEIGALPKPDLSRIASMNPAADTETALNTNYTLKMNQRRLENAKADTTKDSLKMTIESNKANIAASVDGAYTGVTSAKDAYAYAGSYVELQNLNLKNARSRHALGMITDTELKSQEIQTELAQIAADNAAYQLLQAMMNYEYTVNGLAGA